MVSAMWKSVATGVVAASVGAAAFGAVHYMFLAQQVNLGQNFFGIPYTTLLPIVLGTVGMVAGKMYFKSGIGHDVITYGGAAAIGFGIADYAGWISPRAPIPTRAYAPARMIAPPASMSLPSNGMLGTKMI